MKAYQIRRFPMTVNRFRMVVLSVFLVLVVASAHFSGQAQNPPGPPPGAGQSNQSLYDQVAALTARVSKLEGNITAADLAGTYAIKSFEHVLYPGFPAKVESSVTVGTATLAADGTGSFTGTDSVYQLIQGQPWSLSPFSGNVAGSFTWTYADGTLTISFPGDPDQHLSVGAGGRVLVSADVNPPPVVNGVTSLTIATRLQ
jgi:hypothetical protein